jgi:hypothetical protein
MVELTSTIVCPACGHRRAETMAEDAIQVFYRCENCGTLMKPKWGKCCVFCSYGDVKCPASQQKGRHSVVKERLGA